MRDRRDLLRAYIGDPYLRISLRHLFPADTDPPLVLLYPDEHIIFSLLATPTTLLAFGCVKYSQPALHAPYRHDAALFTIFFLSLLVYISHSPLISDSCAVLVSLVSSPLSFGYLVYAASTDSYTPSTHIDKLSISSFLHTCFLSPCHRVIFIPLPPSLSAHLPLPTCLFTIVSVTNPLYERSNDQKCCCF